MIASRLAPAALPTGDAIRAPGVLIPAMQTGTAMGSSGLPRLPQPGMLDRIGSFINSDEGRAILLRSGAATLNGGIGEGILAGAQYADQRRAQAAGTQQQGFENLLKEHGLAIQQQQADQSGAYQTGQLGVSVAELEQRAKDAAAGRAVTARGQDITQRGQTLDYQSAHEGHAIAAQGQVLDSADRRYGVDTNARESAADRVSREAIARTTVDGRTTVAGMRPAAGIGSKAPGAAMQKAAQVLPADATPDDLSVGTVYRTARGLGQWDGRQFVPVQ